MPKITKSEWLDKFSKFIGEDTSEEAIELIEDVSDSWDESGEDWHAKYDELDETWKKRYRDRFFEGSSVTPTGEPVAGATNAEQNEKEEILTYEDFFESIKMK